MISTARSDKRADLREGHGLVVDDAALLRQGRQQLVEVPLPARRIFAGAVATRLCPIEDVLDPAPKTAGRFGLGGPDRFEDLQDKAGIYVLNRQRADYRPRVGFKG